MKVLFLTFYYPPDLSAGSFRAGSLIPAILKQFPEDTEIELMTTYPNRYSSFKVEVPEYEKIGRLTIHRLKLPPHSGGMRDQIRSYMSYAFQVLKLTRKKHYDLVFITSGRLMSAFLGSIIARIKKAKLYIDIRDIFADTMKDVLPSYMSALAFQFILILEKFTINRADKVNLVSRGFEPYFQKRYPLQKYSYFTNGIDEEFMHVDINRITPTKAIDGRKTVLYAGNFGDGQGLHLIIPQLASMMKDQIKFRVIGDGSKREHLIRKIQELGCDNVEIVPPMKRNMLLDEYLKADVLFLHLNDYDAFTKVLPSKIFEYASMGKPIWGGLAGYAAEFARKEVENNAVFDPCNPKQGQEVFAKLKFETTPRTDFMKKHSRVFIMSQMSNDILSVIK